jgi:fatty-acyl-CoA synthase
MAEISLNNKKLPKTLVEMIYIPSVETPDKVAIAFVGQDENLTFLSYQQLWSSSVAVARKLKDSSVKPGDRVLLINPNNQEFIEYFFGTLIAGAVPVPYTPPFGLAKIESYIVGLEAIAKDSGAKVCLTNNRLELLLRGATLKFERPLSIMNLGSASKKSKEIPYTLAELNINPSDLAFLQYTSGSTSQPKGVMLSHQNIMVNISAFLKALQVSTKDVSVSWLPLFHDMGLIGMLMGTLCAKATLYLIPPELFIRSPSIWLRSLSKFGGTITAAPNFAFHYCVKRISEETAKEFDLSRVRVMLNGAEPVDIEAVEKFNHHFSVSNINKKAILPVYGLAESSLAVAFPHLGHVITDEVDADLLEVEGIAQSPSAISRRRTFVSVGKPIDTQEIKIMSDDDILQEERQVGEICVKGPSVMQGYYGKPEASAENLVNGWLKTGDYGYLADGNLYITGRKKDLIIRRGRNYFPQDIEEVVDGVAGVRKGRVVAFGISKDGSDTEIVIIAETRIQNELALENVKLQIKQVIAQSFPFSPLEVRMVPPGTIPRTSSGKIRRQPCKDFYLAGTLQAPTSGGILALRKLMLQMLYGNARHLAMKAAFWR